MNESITYNRDCMDVTRLYPDKHFDLAIVDPPYGLKKDTFHGRGKLKDRFMNRHAGEVEGWDTCPDPSYFEELFRVSRNQIIWGGNYFNLPPCRCFIVWDKQQPWENFSQAEIAWTSFDKPAKMFRRFPYRKTNIPWERKIHPTQKPVELYDYLLERFARPGDKILDTHLGSGSSRISAMKHGCPFIGCEADPAYFSAQEERFSLFLHDSLAKK